MLNAMPNTAPVVGLEAPTRPVAVPVLGVPLARIDYERTLDWIDEAVAAGSREYICVAAVHTVMASQEDPELRDAVLAARCPVPDGHRLVWALRSQGHVLGDRVYGPTLMDKACAR